MHIFPASLSVYQSRQGVKRVAFDVDDLHSELVAGMAASPLGTHFLLVAYEISKDVTDIQEAHTDGAATRNKMMKRVHAIISDYSDKTGVDSEIIKNVFRLRLQHNRVIKESLSELDELKMAQAIYILNTELDPSRFNYDDYK